MCESVQPLPSPMPGPKPRLRERSRGIHLGFLLRSSLSTIPSACVQVPVHRRARPHTAPRTLSVGGQQGPKEGRAGWPYAIHFASQQAALQGIAPSPPHWKDLRKLLTEANSPPPLEGSLLASGTLSLKTNSPRLSMDHCWPGTKGPQGLKPTPPTVCEDRCWPVP